MSNEYQVTQVTYETLNSGAPGGQVTQTAIETVNSGTVTVPTNVTQMAIEAVNSGLIPVPALVSVFAIETLVPIGNTTRRRSTFVP